MDLKDLIPTTNTVDVELIHPFSEEPLLNDDGTPMSITLYAAHSKEYKAALHEQTNIRLKKAQDNKGKIEVTAEEMEKSNIDLIAKATKSWNLTFDGDSPDFTVAKAKELYDEVFWMRGQIEEALANSLDFTKT